MSKLSPPAACELTSIEYFPKFIDQPFKHGLIVVLIFTIVACLAAAFVSWLRGSKLVNEES